MQNKEKWKPVRMPKDSRGRIIGDPFAKTIGYAYEAVIRQYARGKLADIGCGDVPYYAFYKDQVEDNFCVDWENSTLDFSFCDQFADLNQPFPSVASDSFDTVLCTDVLEHIKAPDILFSELSRILKPGGNLILTVPFLFYIHEDPHDYHRYTKSMLKEFCRRNQLEVVSIHAYGGLPEVVFDLVYKGYGFYNLPFKSIFLELFAAFGLMISKFGFVSRMSERSKEAFPQGYILVARK